MRSLIDVTAWLTDSFTSSLRTSFRHLMMVSFLRMELLICSSFVMTMFESSGLRLVMGTSCIMSMGSCASTIISIACSLGSVISVEGCSVIDRFWSLDKQSCSSTGTRSPVELKLL